MFLFRSELPHNGRDHTSPLLGAFVPGISHSGASSFTHAPQRPFTPNRVVPSLQFPASRRWQAASCSAFSQLDVTRTISSRHRVRPHTNVSSAISEASPKRSRSLGWRSGAFLALLHDTLTLFECFRTHHSGGAFSPTSHHYASFQHHTRRPFVGSTHARQLPKIFFPQVCSRPLLHDALMASSAFARTDLRCVVTHTPPSPPPTATANTPTPQHNSPLAVESAHASLLQPRYFPASALSTPPPGSSSPLVRQ